MACDTENILEFKLGSVATLDMTYERDGELVNLEDGSHGIEIDYLSLYTGEILAALAIGEGIIITGLGTYKVDPGNTSDWPVGRVEADIKYTVDTIPRNTDSFYMDFFENITK